MTAGTTTGVSEGRVGRYLLDDLVADSGGSALWRATDPALQRAVGARLIPLDDPRAPGLRKAAKAAARVHDRRLVQVLDVVETDEHMAVITEWVDGKAWSEFLTDPWSTEDALIVAYEVARALEVAHRRGATHGRIRPSSVVITDDNEVRLRGLGVDAALHGVAPPGDARAADVHGIGALLFAGVTARWPDPHPNCSTIDGLPVIGPVGGALPLPSEIVAGIPSRIDTITRRTLIGGQPPKGLWPYADVAHVIPALTQAMGPGSEPEDTGEPDDQIEVSADRAMWRLGTGIVLVLVLVATVLLGVQLVRESPTTPVSEPPPILLQPGGSDAEDEQSSAPLRPIQAVLVTDFDPQGADGTENPDLVPLALDGDENSAWRTVRYVESDLSPKTGTGLLVDLGLVRPLREIDLLLVGNSTDVEIRIADEYGASPDDYELLAGAVAAGDNLVLRTPVPVTTRYVLIWITNLPYGEGAYEGGIREFKIRG